MKISDESPLGVFQRKVLRKIYGFLRVDKGEYRSRSMKLYGGIVQPMEVQRLRLLGHVVPMNESAPALKVFDAVSFVRNRKVLTPLERLGVGLGST